MTKFLSLLIVLFSLGCVTVSPTLPHQNLEQVAFLLGCWKNSHEGKVRVENWREVSPNQFMANGNEYQGKKKIFWEKISIKVTDNQLIYSPRPFGKESVDFKFENQSDSTQKAALFFNQEHDFPQTILYSLDIANQNILRVQVNGLDKNKQPTGFQYSLNKVSCEEK